jgi:3',5'-cyclic AMP phosphodiesterase CpdA
MSRRSFLKCSMALGAAAVMPRGLLGAALPSVPRPGPDHLALLSDVHISGGLNGMMSGRLKTAVEQVLALPQMPQRVMVAGDCAHLRGNAGDYREYARRIKPLTDAGLPLHMTMGNHDHREHFWEELPRERPDARFAMHRQSMVVQGEHANWFLLDTLNQDDRESGELGKDQLEWLAAEVDARAGKPALILLHHDPLRDGKPASLIDAERLLALARPRRQVKAMFFGHTHIWSTKQDVSGIHLVNLPATGYTLWGRSFLGWVDCRVYGDNVLLEVHALNPNQKEHRQMVRLKWRSGAGQ